MYRLPPALRNALEAGQPPVFYITITTDMGQYYYGDQVLPPLIPSGGGYYLSVEAGLYLSVAAGLMLASSGYFVVFEPKIIRFGFLERTLLTQKTKGAVFSTKGVKSHLTVYLNNTDKHFSQRLPKEPFVGKAMQLVMGITELPVAEHFNLFQGIIEELVVSDVDLKLKVIEE